MKINCPNCDKTFILKDELIPSKGRLLQCGNCHNKWFFKKKIIEENKIADISNEINENKSSFNNEKHTNNNEKHKNRSKDTAKIEEVSKKKEFINNKKDLNYMGLFIVTIITAIAFIILIDTFKSQISIVFPEINIFLNNLYETLKDINLFFKDLIR